MLMRVVISVVLLGLIGNTVLADVISSDPRNHNREFGGSGEISGGISLGTVGISDVIQQSISFAMKLSRHIVQTILGMIKGHLVFARALFMGICDSIIKFFHAPLTTIKGALKSLAKFSCNVRIWILKWHKRMQENFLKYVDGVKNLINTITAAIVNTINRVMKGVQKGIDGVVNLIQTQTTWLTKSAGSARDKFLRAVLFPGILTKCQPPDTY